MTQDASTAGGSVRPNGDPSDPTQAALPGGTPYGGEEPTAGQGGAAASGEMTPGEALYWLERRALAQRDERSSYNRNRWTLRDIAAVEALVAAADEED